MEKFKVCEQKTKMKAYSKEALSQKQIQRRKKTKNIPETLEKKEAKKWIKDSETTIEELLEDLEEKMEEERNSRKPDKYVYSHNTNICKR
jgi:CCR4-NOT transcriptional regulation complex NOT5 subunit